MTQLKPTKETNNMTNTIKTAIIALIIISAAMMSGCLDGTDTAKEDETIESMVRLEAILTDPDFSEDNAEMMAKAITEMEAITGEKYELNSEENVTPTVDTPKYRLQYSLGSQSSSPLDGVGWFTISIGGILEPDNTTISGFTEPSLDKIENIEVFINNESMDKFVPIASESRKVTTTIVGDWNIRIVATLKDGTTITANSNIGWGMRDMSDHPDYKKSEITVTGSGPFDARYIETDDKAMTQAEAKALCDELGIVWGDDRDC